ncbi:MAG: hypothetical protein ACXVI9_14125, partial [Mucilaginibacter sp.]
MKNKKKLIVIGIIGAFILLVTCALITVRHKSSHEQMIEILKEIDKKNHNAANPFNPQEKLALCDSVLNANGSEHDEALLSAKASLDLKVGKEEESVRLYQELERRADFMSIYQMMPDMAIAYMRLGERTNGMLNHTGSSCIFPIKDSGVHRIKTGSQNAIDVYKSLLKIQPKDLESKWLLNIAFMTLGRYPKD